MKCMVCETELISGSSECSCCGFPVIVVLGDSPEAAEEYRKQAAEYRAEKCKDIEIGFYAYSHKVVEDDQGNEQLKRDRTDQVPLAAFGALQEGLISWNSEGFLRPLTARMDCSIYIRRGAGNEKSLRLDLPVPAGTGDVRIGIERTDDLHVKICVGETGAYSQSDEINVLTA